MPRPDDMLWIVTDGSTKNKGIAATLYTNRHNRLVLSGFFNAKLRKNQINWLPCEIKALAIGALICHFAPYIVQSIHTTQVLTDNRPFVQAYEKLLCGEFSSSPRVSTFLSLASRYHTQIRHIRGIANIPSDFASRNSCECIHPNCQICKFVNEIDESVVRSVSINDVLNGSTKMPFTSHPAWHAIQMECSDLCRTHSQLTQGTRPSKKITNAGDVKRKGRPIDCYQPRPIPPPKRANNCSPPNSGWHPNRNPYPFRSRIQTPNQIYVQSLLLCPRHRQRNK